MPIWLKSFAYIHSCLEGQSSLLQIICWVQQFKTGRKHNTRHIYVILISIPAINAKLRLQHDLKTLIDLLQIIALDDVTGAQTGRLLSAWCLQVRFYRCPIELDRGSS